MIAHAPANEAEAQAVIAEAASRRAPLSLEGGGTKRGIGRPTQTDGVLTSRNLSGITLHEPAELVIAARSGTPLAEVEAAHAAKGQRLPFEPLDYRALLGSSGEPTIGGMAAANLSGPRRIQAGACRDSFLGTRFVNGRGELVKSGGRVMKNVTGLDLTRLMAGAHGTLGFLTEVTFKVLPMPQTQATLVIAGLDDERGVAALSAGLGSPFEVTGAAHLPAGIGEARARTVLRLEGSSVAIAYRSERLVSLLAPFGKTEIVGPEASAALWLDIRDVRLLAEPPESAIWRISVAPSRGPGLVETLRRKLEARHFSDWGGGLIWLACPATGDAGAAVIHVATAAAGGHATLIRAPDAVRAAVEVFQPQAEAVAKLSRGVKASFDPLGVLEPGRMYAGI